LTWKQCTDITTACSKATEQAERQTSQGSDIPLR